MYVKDVLDNMLYIIGLTWALCLYLMLVERYVWFMFVSPLLEKVHHCRLQHPPFSWWKSLAIVTVHHHQFRTVNGIVHHHRSRWLAGCDAGNTNAGPAYRPTMMMGTSKLDWRSFRQWSWEHQQWNGVPSGDDDGNINGGPAYHPAVMMGTSTPDRRTIRWRWWWEHQRRTSVPSGSDDGMNINTGPSYHPRWWEHEHQTGVPSGGDDENMNAGPAYHPVVMLETSSLELHTIRRWCRYQRN